MPSPALSLLLFLILQGPLPGQAVWEERQGHGEAVSGVGTLKPRQERNCSTLGKAKGLTEVTLLEESDASMSQVSPSALTARS